MSASRKPGRVRVVVAMSGGVDSSVAAALVSRAGYEAVGVTLRLLQKLDTGFGCCGSPEDVSDAKKVCETLGIPHYVLDAHELFEERVVSPFVGDYLESRTPNPCVECNRHVKFGHLSRLAEAWDASFVATGHYARVENGRLFRALDEEKDQTYFLYSLTSRELKRVLFPIGGLPKAEVRRIARELGLATAEKPESQEICFVPRRDYRGFIKGRSPETVGISGPIQDREGRTLGTHAGLENYTVGQRRGVGVSSPEPLYVTGMDPKSRTLYVGLEAQTYSHGLVAGNVSWTQGPPDDRAGISVRIRHRARLAPCCLSLDGERVRVGFSEPQRAVAPGQAAVFYRGDEALGGGTIMEAI